MCTRKLVTKAILIIVAFLNVHVVFAAPYTNAKIATHVVSHNAKVSVCSLDPPPCVSDTSYVVTSASIGAPYDIYLYVSQVDSTLGIAGVSFGVDYNGAEGVGVDAYSFSSCADLTFPTFGWPDAGTGINLTWDSGANCQRTPVTGQRDVAAIAGSMYVYAYSADIFSITAHPNSGKAIKTSCALVDVDMRPERALGAVSFGQAGGFDPCFPYSSISHFDSLQGAELDSLQVRLLYTWMDVDQVVLTTSPVYMDSLAFDRFTLSEQDKGISVGISPVVVSGAQLEAIVDTLVALGVAAGEWIDGGSLFITLTSKIGGELYGFEAVLDSAAGTRLVGSVLDNLQNNPEEYSEVYDFACFTDFLPFQTPTDVTSSVGLSYSGYRFDRDSGTYSTVLTIKNIDASAIASPISVLVFADPLYTELANADGTTCRLRQAEWYIDALESGSLAPSAEITKELRFYHSAELPLDFDTWVYSGPGYK